MEGPNTTLAGKMAVAGIEMDVTPEQERIFAEMQAAGFDLGFVPREEALRGDA